MGCLHCALCSTTIRSGMCLHTGLPSVMNPPESVGDSPHHVYLDEVYEHWSAANLSGRNPNYVWSEQFEEDGWSPDCQVCRIRSSCAVTGGHPRRKCPAQCFSRASRRVDLTWAPDGVVRTRTEQVLLLSQQGTLFFGAGGTSGYLSSIYHNKDVS